MLSIVTLPQADKDTDGFFLYIANNSLTAANRFYDRLEETFTIIAEYPQIATAFKSKDSRLANLRWFPVKNFPKHLVFYIANEQQITIVRVLHASQNISKILS